MSDIAARIDAELDGQLAAAVDRTLALATPASDYCNCPIIGGSAGRLECEPPPRDSLNLFPTSARAPARRSVEDMLAAAFAAQIA